MTTGGPIRCSSISYGNTLISDMGPLTGQTLIDYSSDGRTSCAISSSNVAYCWGENSSAAVGDNTTTNRPLPTPVYTGGALFGVSLKKIAANAYGACAISIAGQMYCWGDSQGYGVYDRFYTGESYSTRLIPPKAVSDSQLTSLTWADVETIGSTEICAMSTTRVFKCFGPGIATWTTSAIPSGETIVSMSATQQYGDLHACALSDIGKVYCNGAFYFRPAVASSRPAEFAHVALPSTAVSVRVADGIACAVLNSGGVSCWGIGLRRTTGLGLSGYRVVSLLPSGSGASEVAALMSYSNYPLILVRTSTGQLLKFQFASDDVDTEIPPPADISLQTPRVTVDKVVFDNPGYHSSCGAGTNEVCVSLEGMIDDLSYTSVTYNIYGDSGRSILRSSASSKFEYRNVSIGTVNGLTDHWVTLTVSGPYGTTTTSPIYIARRFFPSSSAYVSTPSSSAYFSTPSTKTITVRGVQLRKSVSRFSRHSLKSIIRVKSTGKQTWSVSRGCSIRGGFLITTNAKLSHITSGASGKLASAM
jgi:hypothetical protein